MGKKKNEKKEEFRGKTGFEKYYSQLFQERWKSLKESFEKENTYSCWKIDGFQSYFLDSASVFAALQLPLTGATKILDMCAAPGGKTLVLASRMEESTNLHSNERSFVRKQRLVQVCNSCLPQDVLKRITITCSDAAKLCTKNTECYERILLDAPCSSERHVFNDEKYLSQWSPARIKTLAIEQWALLSSAYRLLTPGGYLLYSTCALNPTENDGVLERLYKKFPDAKNAFEENVPKIQEDISKFCKMDFIPCVEKTKYGFHILPDVQNGCGPIWFAMIQKAVCAEC